MPFTTQQLVRGADYTLQTFNRAEPVDQINTQRRLLKWLMAHKEESTFGNGVYSTPVFMDNSGNYQRYFGAQQVTYNQRDPVRQAKYNYFRAHEGFWFDEDTLLANNITINDDGMEAPTKLEKDQLVNLLGQSYRAMANSIQNGLALDCLQDGSQSALAPGGLDLIVSTTPSTGTIGTLAASNTWWRDNIALGLAQNVLIANMEEQYQNCIKYGGVLPTAIFCGQAFYNDYRVAAQQIITRQIHAGGNEKGGVSMDPSTGALFFKNLELIWDPMFEALDAVVGVITHPWTKRCYFLNDKNITLRPVRGGAWMQKRKPERLPDRYVHYWAQTLAYGITTNKRNSMAVFSID